MAATRRPAAELAPPDRFWSHVAAFGALWGSLEITLGSFLHALRIPGIGVLLACLGAMLLIAARQIVSARGATLATGIVAALCKSISPGGIILGPMAAITVEALLVELALLVAPRARTSALCAGALCALWAASQKVISQVVYFGGNILALYLAALRQARDGLGLPTSTGWWVLLALLVTLFVVGGSAGLLGRRIGMEAREAVHGA